VGDPVKKRNALEEFLNLDPDAGVIDQARGVLNQHPALKAQEGMTSLGSAASKALGTVGAGVDDLFGTSGDAASPDVFPRAQKIAPLSPGPLPPDALSPSPERRGPFEAMGENAAGLGAYLAGNALPFANPVGAGAVAAFPSPAQSLKRMQEEAMFRDTMEAKGAKAIEPPSRLPSSAAERLPETAALSAQLGRIPEQARRHDKAHAGLRSEYQGNVNADALRVRAARDANNNTAGGFRALSQIEPMDDVSYSVRHESQAKPYKSEARIPRPDKADKAERDALEQYLSGLYGPRGK